MKTKLSFAERLRRDSLSSEKIGRVASNLSEKKLEKQPPTQTSKYGHFK